MTVINPWEDSHLDCIASAQIKLGFFSQKSSKFLHIFLKELWTSLSFYRYICTFIYGYIHTVSQILLWRDVRRIFGRTWVWDWKQGLGKRLLIAIHASKNNVIILQFPKQLLLNTLFLQNFEIIEKYVVNNTECSLNIVF